MKLELSSPFYHMGEATKKRDRLAVASSSRECV